MPQRVRAASSDDPDLPVASHAVAVGSALVLTVSSKDISIAGRRLQETAPLLVDGNWSAPAVEVALQQSRRERPELDLLIAANASVPYQLVKKIQFLGMKVGFTGASIAVKDARTGTVLRLALASPPAPVAGAPARRPRSDASIGMGGDKTVVDGSLDPAIVDAVLKRHLAQIQVCYESGLERKPTLGGSLLMSFTVEPDGHVSQASVKQSTVGDPVFAKCLSDRFLTVLFPKPRTGSAVKVSYPFLFLAPDAALDPTPAATDDGYVARSTATPIIPSLRLEIRRTGFTLVEDETKEVPIACRATPCGYDFETLSARLAGEKKRLPDDHVTLFPEDSTRWGDVVHTMDSCIESGLDDIARVGTPL